MFATYAEHKLPIQYPGDPSTVWTGVEVVLNFPFFLCTIAGEEIHQRFFLTQEEDVMRLAKKTGDGRLVAVDLVIPPESSGESAWTILPVIRMMRRRTPVPGEPRIGLVLFTRGGRSFAGYPLVGVTPVDPSSLILIADFEVRGMAAG